MPVTLEGCLGWRQCCMCAELDEARDGASPKLNIFIYLPKTPFIWHLTSGSYHALELFVSIYKWNRDTLLRIKSVY